MDSRRNVRLVDLGNIEGTMTLEERILGRNIGIIGMARSGMAVARLALRRGGKPYVSDSALESKVLSQTVELTKLGISYETGGHTERLLQSDYIIVSPGVPLSLEILQQARTRGIPVFSELEFGSWVCRGKIIAITGTNGKTTTTTLIGDILKAAGHEAFICGNIGLPLSEIADQINDNAYAVVEASSFQLETIADFKPHVALLLNLTSDHLDWHGGFENYKKAKYRITENQNADNYFIVNKGDAEISSDNPASSARKIYFSTVPLIESDIVVRDGSLCVKKDGQLVQVLSAKDILIPGPHNLQNAAAALAVGVALGLSLSTVALVLKRFPGVEHRLERAGRVAGVNFINDSKATNVDSVCYALKSVEQPIVLICGGRDKGGSYAPMIEAGRGKVKGLIAIGEAKEKIFVALAKSFSTQFASSLEEAVITAFELAMPGDTVLLSPGCSSFDMFENFEHRGRAFKAAVAGLRNGKKSNEKISG